MKLSPRVAVPIGLAVVCAGLLIAVLWWYLARSASVLQTHLDQTNLGVETTSLIALDTGPIDPNDRTLFFMRQGDLLALQGKWLEAGEQYQLAVDADGGLPALRKLAEAQLQQNDTRGLSKTINKLKQAGAKPADLLLIESVVQLRQGELVEAREMLTGAEESPQKNYGLALLNMIEGDHVSAQAALEQVIAGWEPVLRTSARTLQAAYQEFALFPEGKNTHLITLLARALAQVRECELALPLMVQVTQLEVNYRDAWIVQGYCELMTKRSRQALASLEQAYNLDPEKAEIQYFLARAYRDTGDPQGAITFLEYALQNGFEPAAEVRTLLAEVALEIGNTQLALLNYQKLLEEPEASINAYLGFINTAMALEQSATALETAQLATEKFPEEALAFEALGKVALAVGNQAEAKRAFEKALKLNPFLDDAKKALQGLN